MNDIIESISCEKEIIQLKLLNVPKHPKMIAKIFSILKDEEINEKQASAGHRLYDYRTVDRRNCRSDLHKRPGQGVRQQQIRYDQRYR